MAAAPHSDHIRRRLQPLRDMAATPLREPLAIEEQRHPVQAPSEPPLRQRIDDTIATVERAVASLGSLRSELRLRQQETEALKREIQAGQSEERQLKDRIGELERVFATERQRAAAAEHRARWVDTNIDDLERRIEAIKAETAQLIEAATLLLAGEAEASRPRRAMKRERYAA